MRTRHLGPPAFARAARRYLRHFRALGLRYRGVEQTLAQIGHHLSRHSARDLDSALYESWRASRITHPNSRRKAEQTLHRFCRYRRRSEPATFVPSPDAFTRLRPYVRPVIVEPEQVARMMQAAAALPLRSRYPLRPAVARMATVLLYTAGLRMGELLRLNVEDIEDEGSVLQIRESKFHKSRLVPLSESARTEVRRYLEERAIIAPDSPDRGPFLCHRRCCGLLRYSASGFQSLISNLFRLAAVRDREGRTPRLHDLRHSFAVQSLIQCYRGQGDPQVQLPKLALYMGHASVESTIHYLKLVPQVAALASARFDSAYGAQVLGEQP